MMTTERLRARATRLMQLNLGIAKEVAAWTNADSVLHRSERVAYLKSLQDGMAGLDAAWQTLTQALRRIDDEAAARGGREKHPPIPAGSRPI